MPINITMPALSPTMEEGNLTKWLVSEGDKVAPGDVIAEIETDKATMEVEAVDEGIVARILVPEGTEGVKVNAPIAILAADGEDPAEAAKGAGDAQAAAAKDKSSSKEKEEKPEPKVDATPKAEPQAQPQSAPAASADARAPAAEKEKGGERIFASPLARRLAKEAGIDLAAISGSGPHGRIVRRDVEAAQAAPREKPAAAPAAAPAPAPAAPQDEQILALFAEGSYELRPHDSMRRTIARRLIEAKTTIPHFYLTLDCEIDALLALRAQINDAAPQKDGQPAYKVSVNDMVIKAMALALQRVPEANASWTQANMVLHKHSDIGVAVAIPGGLITPIVRKAELKTLSVIANEMKDLAARARERRLKPEEYQGGSTAISNLGMYGISNFSAIINPPQATILAVGKGEQRPIVRNGQVAVATLMSVTLSTDHRVVDGALGAELLTAFRELIEKPMAMLV